MAFIYIMTNRPRGTLYIGVTSDLIARIYQHRIGKGSRFAHRYNLTRLVYMEEFADIARAIAREKQLKHRNRQWKIDLIEKTNHDWLDLYERIHR